jgi:hypothetical protein
MNIGYKKHSFLLIVFIARWKNSEVTVNDILSALDRWMQGA